MKILFTNFHPNNGGGHTTYIINLLKHLHQQHQCVVATPASSRLYKFAQALPSVQRHAEDYPKNFFKTLAHARALKRYLKQERFDIIHVNGSADHKLVWLACAGWRQRPNIIWTKHNTKAIDSIGNRLRASVTDRVIAVSEFVRQIVRQSPYAQIPCDMIHHGIDTDYFSPPSPSQKQRWRGELIRLAAKQNPKLSLSKQTREDWIILGSSGGTDFEKGWREMVSAVSQLPEDKRRRCLIMVAGKPPKTEVRNFLAQTGIAAQIVFPGLVDDVRPLLGACDLGFVLSHDEALSFACRECMALGLPTIISDAGGLPENLEHGKEGWIVQRKNSQAVLELLLAILDKPSLLEEVGQAARRKAENQFTMSQFVQSTTSSYQHLLAQSKKA
ncbi:glycosyltransferase [Brackiella oedipodis]|uniref:glycosyltransferase n=1 Tax=Brackiella oedipodis TaxID=124225 RepID=UPI000490ABD4|nr:glycosyltransferase [Brackiella oedipodis]